MNRLLKTGLLLVAAGCFFHATTYAGPNIIAVGNFDELPRAEAVGRDSTDKKSVIFTFDDPRYDFGKVVVRSTEPNVIVRKNILVAYDGSGLRIGSRENSVSAEVELWLKIRGKLLPGHTYEWECDWQGQNQNDESGFQAFIPMMWTDAGPIASEVFVRGREAIMKEIGKETDAIRRMIFPHGLVTLPSFETQTGAAWVVLKRTGGDQGNFRLVRFTLREVDSDTAPEAKDAMPVPVRYVAIRSQLESQIGDALERTPKTLREIQSDKAEGFWQGQDLNDSVQLTAEVVTALAEVDPEGEGLSKSMEWLSRQVPPNGQSFTVMTVASRLYCLARFGGLEKYQQVIHKDVQFLLDAQREKDGGWSNVGPEGKDRTSSVSTPDHIHSAKALVALREARYGGAVVENRVWPRVLAYWTDAQVHDGGFRDKLDLFGGLGQATTSAYTAMGAAALLTAIDMGASLDARSCKSFLGNRDQLRGIDRAMQWLNKNYSEQFMDIGSPFQRNDPYLEAASLRWVGASSGLAFFHEKDHFLESAKEIFEGYDPGSGMFGIPRQEAPSVSRTAQALQIIASGAAPTVCQRIHIGDGKEQWGEYGGNVNHLVRSLSRLRSKKFNWRRTTIDREVRELAEVPLLFVDVSGPIPWKPEQWKKLREYVFAGGTIVLNINEGQEAQREVVVKALKESFPEYDLRDLPADSPLFSLETKVSSALSIKALGNGVRDFIFLPAQSWSCVWHLYQGRDKEPSLQFMNNLLTYATDSAPPRSSFVQSTYAPGSASTQKMSALHVETGGKLPAYPNLIETMDRLMETNFRVSVDKTADALKADLVWISVTGEDPLSETAKTQMVNAINNGKFLLIDVVTGNKDWDESIQPGIKSLAPGVTLEALRRNDPVYTGQILGTTGFDAVEIAFRKSLHTRWSKSGRAKLFGIHKDGVLVGIYSAQDLASGIGYHWYPNCIGVAPDGARRLVMNAFLTAHGRKSNAFASR